MPQIQNIWPDLIAEGKVGGTQSRNFCILVSNGISSKCGRNKPISDSTFCALLPVFLPVPRHVAHFMLRTCMRHLFSQMNGVQCTKSSVYLRGKLRCLSFLELRSIMVHKANANKKPQGPPEIVIYKPYPKPLVQFGSS
jgi:hypothetical protein